MVGVTEEGVGHHAACRVPVTGFGVGIGMV